MKKLLFIGLIALAGITGKLSWFGDLPFTAFFTISVVASIFIFIVLIRYLAKKARNSVIAMELFCWLTGYKEYIEHTRAIISSKYRTTQKIREN